MRRYRVAFDEGFEADLARYEDLLEGQVTPDRLAGISRAIVGFCRRLETAPIRGTDWGDGLRTVPALDRGTVLFRVDEVVGTVTVLGWWWRGAPAVDMVARHRG